MRQLPFVFLLLIFFAACSKKDQVPKDIMPKEKMEAVLWDLVRAGEFLETFVMNKDSTIDKAAKAVQWYDNVFMLHKTNRTVFEKSYAWYRDHPIIMKEILDSLAAKPTPLFTPPGQADSTGAKDSPATGPFRLPGSAHPTFNVDSLRKARMKMKAN